MDINTVPSSKYNSLSNNYGDEEKNLSPYRNNKYFLGSPYRSLCLMNKILIIEDDAELRELMRESLADREFEIIVAESGQDGVEKAQKYLPNAIVCDITMPGLDGFEVLKILRQDFTTAMIPFIFLTAVKSEEQRAYALKLGAKNYLNKPCTVQELQDAISMVLNSQ